MLYGQVNKIKFTDNSKFAMAFNVLDNGLYFVHFVNKDEEGFVKIILNDEEKAATAFEYNKDFVWTASSRKIKEYHLIYEPDLSNVKDFNFQRYQDRAGGNPLHF
mmetsp:Transcript_31692/g.5737  ORF Transcript_31692/g.5737 Transcript_31692/m.5737 type:complete len:105 (-) Transcript_31692:2948-3262(-)